MRILVVGAGIGGLTLALSLHKAGLSCVIFDTVREIKPLGAGINLLPHAVRQLDRLGLTKSLLELGIETQEVCFYTRHGQLVDSEPRGRFAGYEWPQISIHRADLHRLLLNSVRERLGQDAVNFDRRCVGFGQTDSTVSVELVNHLGIKTEEQGDVLVACDGVHSVIQRILHPEQPPLIDHGTKLYRGVTRAAPFLSGRSMVYSGTNESGKLVVYPIRNNADQGGSQLINWVVEVNRAGGGERDWNRTGSIDECFALVKGWNLPFLDVGSLLKSADVVLDTPCWTKPRSLIGELVASRYWAMQRTPCCQEDRTELLKQ